MSGCFTRRASGATGFLSLYNLKKYGRDKLGNVQGCSLIENEMEKGKENCHELEDSFAAGFQAVLAVGFGGHIRIS